MQEKTVGGNAATGLPPSQGRGPGWTLPLAWVGLAMFLSLRALWQLMPLAAEDSLPGEVVAWVRASLAGAAVTLVWGGLVLLLARVRSPRLRGAFVAWQLFQLLALAASVGWSLFADDLVAPAAQLLLPAAEAAVGGWLLWYARRLPSATAPRAAGPRGPGAPLVPGMTRVLHAAVGAVAGAALGGVAGFPFGVFLADVLDVSCFEGACGYFAAAIGLLFILLGLIAGIVVALWRTRARSRLGAG